jgi:hypothetical protein
VMITTQALALEKSRALPMEIGIEAPMGWD